MRIAVCTNFVSPYRRPVFAALAQLGGFHVRVFTATDSEHDRDWRALDLHDQPFEVVKSRTVTRRHDLIVPGPAPFAQRLERHYPLSLPIDLMRYQPDVVISGELGPRTIVACATARMMRSAFIPWTYHPTAQAPAARRGQFMRSWVLRNSAAVVGMGSQARRVLRAMGCPDDLIHDAPNAADSSAITARLHHRDHERSIRAIRQRFDNKRIALIVGRPTPMKGHAQIIAAWKNLDPDLRNTWRLVLVGGDPSSERLAEIPGVRSVGFIEPELLPDWFAAADLHVFASLGDPWGLVVNEAMQCGVPTLCSVRAGCADDLIRDGVNGYSFDPADRSEQVTRDLTRALRSTQLRALGRRASRDIAAFTPDNMARGFVNAIESALIRSLSDRKRCAA